MQRSSCRLDGDKLTECGAKVNVDERPTEFKSTKKNRYALITDKRVKKID